jgi:Putative peptidoglycan binding domain
MTSPTPTSDRPRSRISRLLPTRRRRLAAAAGVAIVVVLVAFASSGVFETPSPSAAGVTDNEYPTSTTTVSERSLSEQTQVSATLGYAGSYTVSVPTGTTAPTVAEAQSSATAAETAVTEAKAALANTEATAKPANASTLLAATDTVSADETTLRQAKGQLASDENLGCPISSSSTVTSPTSGIAASNSAGDSSSSSSEGSSASGSSSSSNTSSNSSANDSSTPVENSGSAEPQFVSSVDLTNGSSTSAIPPSATTGSVDETTGTSTVLSGTVNPDGADTTSYFEYGTSPNYGETTPSVDVGSGANGVPITASLSDLSPGATYHYRLIAADAGGATYGQDATFETNAEPTAITGAATSVSTSSESLAGTVGPNGADTTYYFEYGPSASFGNRTAVVDAGAEQSATSVSGTATGLKAGESYDYALVATNSLGAVVGTTETFQTAASSCAAERTVIADDSATLTQAGDAEQVDELGEDSSVTAAEQTVSADEAMASTDEQALSADEAVAANPNATFTTVPTVGTVVHQGQSVYSLNGDPVPLFYGTATPYRALYIGVSPGPDITQLEENLIALGFERGTTGDQFNSTTEAAVRAWQASLDEPDTGIVALGDVVVEPGPIEIATVSVTTGMQASGGTAILTASSTSPVVTIDLDPSLESDVKVGDQVTITLPNNATTSGVISSVGTVATSSSSSSSSTSSSSSSGATITVLATLSNPKDAAGYEEAPVNASITNASVTNVLAAPVDALLALANGGYALEEISSNGVHHLLAVTPGLFDDQAGMVQVSGRGLAAGQKIVIPNV